MFKSDFVSKTLCSVLSNCSISVVHGLKKWLRLPSMDITKHSFHVKTLHDVFEAIWLRVMEDRKTSMLSQGNSHTKPLIYHSFNWRKMKPKRLSILERNYRNIKTFKKSTTRWIKTWRQSEAAVFVLVTLTNLAGSDWETRLLCSTLSLRGFLAPKRRWHCHYNKTGSNLQNPCRLYRTL